MRLDINHITFMMLDDDFDDIHDKTKAADTCDDDLTNDEMLQNSSIPDVYDFGLSDDDRSFVTVLPPLDINTSTLTDYKSIDVPNQPTDMRVYTEIRPFPRSFIQAIRENACPSFDDLVTDIDLANVIFESFEPLLSQPGSYHDLCEQLAIFIRDQHQGEQTSAKKRKGKKKDPNRHKAKNRGTGLKYAKSEKQKLKESKKVVKNNKRSRKAAKKKSDVRTKTCLCLMMTKRTQFAPFLVCVLFCVPVTWPG